MLVATAGATARGTGSALAYLFRAGRGLLTAPGRGEPPRGDTAGPRIRQRTARQVAHLFEEAERYAGISRPLPLGLAAGQAFLSAKRGGKRIFSKLIARRTKKRAFRKRKVTRHRKALRR
jgi:hypothetical protein